MSGDYNFESNIAKSINYFLRNNVFTDWNLTGHKQQFFTRYPVGEYHRPAICTEYQSGKYSQNRPVGIVSKDRIFKITIFGPTATETLNKEEMLEKYHNQIEECLAVQNIPYLRFDHDESNPPQQGVFNIDYISDEIVTELIQKDKNLWVINIRVR
jgi:hypothetical protein